MITVESDALRVRVDPDLGADIASILDRATGTPLLLEADWVRPTAADADAEGIEPSKRDRLVGYRGGWQLLLPNAGEARDHEGIRQGYHGEAAGIAWEVVGATASTVELGVDLRTAPLRLHRVVHVDGARLGVRLTVTNIGTRDVTFRWVEHPAFGAPFIDEHARLEAEAEALVTDADAPGDALPRDRVLPFPSAESLDLSRFPAADAPRSVFAALAGVTAGRYRVVSPTVGLAVVVEWDPAVLPYAWFWQENHASAGFPWYRRAYAFAVEPANHIPGEGRVAHLTRGGGTTLAPAESISTEVTFRREDLGRSDRVPTP